MHRVADTSERNDDMNNFRWNLQMFADGEAGEAANTEMGETTNNEPGVADQVSEADALANMESEFNELIKGKYKDIYGKKVQSVIDKRFKQTKQLEETVKANSEINAKLGAKYGIDPADITALAQAVGEDDSYLEEAAYNNNMTVEQYKVFLEGEEAKRQLEQQRNEQRREQVTQFFNTEAEAVKTKYNDPSFDFWELYETNSEFQAMINSGVPTDTAYRVMNMDRLTAESSRASADRVSKAITNDIIANGKRPIESGLSPNQAPANSSVNIHGLTDSQMDDLIEQARRGQIITFR